MLSPSLPDVCSPAPAPYITLRCVSTTPFGSPVVPDVYRIVAGLSGATWRHRCSHSSACAARNSLPCWRNCSQERYDGPAGTASASSTTTARRVADSSIARPQRASWSAPSRNATDGSA